jgi:hypothetical protein
VQKNDKIELTLATSNYPAVQGFGAFRFAEKETSMPGTQKLVCLSPAMLCALLGVGLLLSIAAGCEKEQMAAAEQPVPKVTTVPVV